MECSSCRSCGAGAQHPPSLPVGTASWARRPAAWSAPHSSPPAFLKVPKLNESVLKTSPPPFTARVDMLLALTTKVGKQRRMSSTDGQVFQCPGAVFCWSHWQGENSCNASCNPGHHLVLLQCLQASPDEPATIVIRLQYRDSGRRSTVSLQAGGGGGSMISAALASDLPPICTGGAYRLLISKLHPGWLRISGILPPGTRNSRLGTTAPGKRGLTVP